MSDSEAGLPFDADALLDGALPPVAAAEATLQVKRDDSVAARFGRHAAATALAKIVLAAKLSAGGDGAEPGDSFAARRLASALSAGNRPGRNWRRGAVAAALLLAVALGAGALGAAWRTDRALQQALSQEAAERRALQAAVQEALEKRPSGQAVVWRSDDGTRSAMVVPLRTYRSASGHWCREYRIAGEAALPAASMRGLACRERDGRWQTAEGHT